jgi:hypothetical protein
MSTKTNRVMAAAAAASIVLTAFGLTPASAAPLRTDVSYRHGGGAAALGAFAALAGTIATIAAAQHDRDAYVEGGPYAYGYGPAPYATAPVYRGGWGGWHGHWHRR